MNNYQYPNVPNQTPCGQTQQRFTQFPEFQQAGMPQAQMGFGFPQVPMGEPMGPVSQPPLGQIPGIVHRPTTSLN